MQKHKPARHDVRARHEKSEIFLPGVVAFLVVMGVSAFFMHAGLWAWVRGMKVAVSSHEIARGNTGGVLPAQTFPKLQVSPQADWRAYREREEKILNSYGWINRTAGVVRVPIGQAIALVVQRGLPRWGPSNRNVSPFDPRQRRAVKGEQAE